MAYDQGFLKITWQFTIVNTDEIALTSLNFSDPGNPTYNPAASLGEVNTAVLGAQLLARLFTLLDAPNMGWADYSRLNSVRIAAVGADGAEIGDAKIFEDLTPAAGDNTGILPQASIVFSTRSGGTTGSANYGRMYMPHTMLNMTAGSPFASTAVTGAVATVFQVFVNGVQSDLETAITAPLEPMIMTQVVGGTSKVITQVAVGNVTDTQRRRRNQLPETYSFRSIP